ncbi:MAG: glycosyltransferase family 4 protein [Pseudomonadales bacterium]|nr:glycosyltransferase family 4 protein [Pseudomonadales bacterium]
MSLNTPLKIGIFVMTFPVPSETFIVTKVLGLLDAGMDVRIFANRPSPYWEKFDILKGREDVKARIEYALPTQPGWKVLTTGLGGLALKMLRHPSDFWRLVRDSWRHRKETHLSFLKRVYILSQFVGHSLDILHIEFDTQALGIIDVKTFLGCKILLSSRGTFQKTTVLDQYPDAPEFLYRYVDGYHFISEYLRNNTYKLGLNRAVPYWLVKPAIDLSLFKPSDHTEKSSQETIRLITVARLAWQKGHEFAIDAVAKASAAGVALEYIIVGDGEYKLAVTFAAHQWGLVESGVIKFTGVVPREQVVAYLHEADIMIHPAIEEGFCNAVIEGQAAELPVIATDAGGLPENIEDGVTGFVVPRRNPDALAEKIIQLARDPELRQRMGKAGRERALKLYDINYQVQQFITLYEELGQLETKKLSDER